MVIAVCFFAPAFSAAIWGTDSRDSPVDVFFDNAIGACGKDAVSLSADSLCAIDYFSYLEEG